MEFKVQLSLLTLGVFLVLLSSSVARKDDDEDENYDPYTTTDPAKREPSPCEICKNFMMELKERLDKSGRSKEVIETGHGLDKKKRFKYNTSELRLTEALHEPHICENIRQYNVHAERKGSNRHAKGMSETFSTLHGLVHKGVKVELGIPYELWDQPSAEIIKMERSCYTLAEKMEDDIEEWYYGNQAENIVEYICRDRVLKGKDISCLEEKFVPKGDTGDDENPEKPKKKKKKVKKNKLKGDTGDESGPPGTEGEEGTEKTASESTEGATQPPTEQATQPPADTTLQQEPKKDEL